MVSRRTLLQSIGLSSVATIAGCSGLLWSGDRETETPTDSVPAQTDTPTATPTATLSPTETLSPKQSTTSQPETSKVSEAAPAFTPEPSDSSDDFGHAVALSEDLAVVLAPDSSAYVFETRNDNWSLSARLTPEAADNFDGPGGSVAMAGETVLIGAPDMDDNGTVYVFERLSGEWAQQSRFVPEDDDDEYRGFGSSIEYDGHRAVVGSVYQNPGTMRSATGAVYVFEGMGIEWVQRAKLRNEAEDVFGASVSIDDQTVLVGAPWAKGEDGGIRDGAVYVYERASVATGEQVNGEPTETESGDSGGSDWVKTAKLTPSERRDYRAFGRAVALNGDTAVVGAPDDGPGSAYFFERTDGEWKQRARVAGANASPDAKFGASVALAGDTAVVCAPEQYETGRAYVFRPEDGEWARDMRLAAADLPANAEFGQTAALQNETVLVGETVYRDRGAAYLFEL